MLFTSAGPLEFLEFPIPLSIAPPQDQKANCVHFATRSGHVLSTMWMWSCCCCSWYRIISWMASFFFKAHLQYKRAERVFLSLLVSFLSFPPSTIPRTPRQFRDGVLHFAIVTLRRLISLTHGPAPSSDSRSHSLFVFLRNFQRFPKKLHAKRHPTSFVCFIGHAIAWPSKRRLFIAFWFSAQFFLAEILVWNESSRRRLHQL